MNRTRALRILGRTTAGLAIGALALAGFVTVRAEQHAAARYDVAVEHLDVPADEVTRARGEHLVRSLAKCVDCHGDDLAGKVMVDSAPVGTLAGPNITPAGVTRAYTVDDWTRAIRHGVAPGGKPLALMPSYDYSGLGKDDVAAIIAYLRAAPPVVRDAPKVRVGAVLRASMVLGSLQLYDVERVDHRKPMSASPRPEANAIYGEYLARTGGCFGCHGPALAGGAIPGMPPSAPKASDLRPTGAIAGWSEADFKRALRTGTRPNGSTLRDEMPWRAASLMTDEEIRALYTFLLPSTTAGTMTSR